MPPNFPLNSPERIFEWLGADSTGCPYYLHPLNLVWSSEGVEHDLDVYQKVAERLAVDLSYWSSLIRNSNWRCTLAGCTCALVTRHTGFFDDLCFRFEAGSMVIPQIAVTLGLLHPTDARTYFELVLETSALRQHPMRLVSAQRVLALLGVLAESEMKLDGWSILDQDYALLADRVVREHWEFWSIRI